MAANTQAHGASYKQVRTSNLGDPGGHNVGLMAARKRAARKPGDPRKRQLVKQADGTTIEKDLSKGWARCQKKITKALSSVTHFFHDWFGIDYDGDWWAPPMTIETLEDAVRDPDSEQVERLMTMGLDPNEAVDEFGYTVLDCLLIEQLQMLQDCQDQRQVGLGPEAITSMFVDHEDAFWEVMDILKDHGAKLSGDKRRGCYVPDPPDVV